jgi:polar amino acid transport system ATP-binding protein
MSAPIIKIDGITKSFGAFKVLDGLSMQVMPGEKLALIGPSGSGKTTILRILMTLERIDGGHIQVEGEQLYHMERNGHLLPADERHLTRMRQKIGMVFQLFNLFPHKSVLDNVTLAPMLTKGTPRAAAEKRAMELLDMVGMADKAKNMPAQLSGGQKQRVAIARALALKPEIVILDEAVSALDVLVQGQILSLLAELQSELGLTYLFITHDLAVVRVIADNVCVMQSGKIVEASTVDEVFDNPQQDYTRDLLNAIPGANIALGV